MKRSNIAIVVFLATALIAATAFGFGGPPGGMAGMPGQGLGGGQGPLVDILAGTPVTVSGVVEDIGPAVRGVVINTGTESVTVNGLGSFFYWEEQGVSYPDVGETITVDGYEVEFPDGTIRLIAASVTVEGETIELRDPETGTPLWRRGGGGCRLPIAPPEVEE